METITRPASSAVNSPNCNGILLVQIPKYAFFGKDLASAEVEFKQKFREIIQQKSMHSATGIANLIGMNLRTGNAKNFIFCEQPLYADILSRLEKFKQTNVINENCDYEWLTALSGIRVQKPLSKDYYTFYIYTGENCDSASCFCTISNIWKMHQEATKEAQEKIEHKNKTDIEQLFLIRDITINNAIMTCLEKVSMSTQTRHFRLNSLEDLSKIFIAE